MKGQPTTSASILNEVDEIVKHSSLIGIGSPRASVESNFALKKLVGEDNFYLGVSEQEYWLNQLVLKVYQHGSVRSLSMKEVEKADVVFILGEDLTNTAPMMALTVRQSVRQVPLQQVMEAKIPAWNDAAARELIQQQNGPLFIGSVNSTKLDSIAQRTFNGSPDDLARIGFAVASILDDGSPSVSRLSSKEKDLAKEIATALAAAKNPAIISGTSCRSEALIMAAANIAEALNKKNKNTGITLILSECNSLGLALLGGKPLKDGFERAKGQGDLTSIILENDLYRHANENEVDEFIRGSKNLIVVDHSVHLTTEKATIVFPAGTFAEADGTLINNEGRAQRYFQVYEPSDDVRESWRWMINIGAVADNRQLSQWTNLDDITKAVSAEVPALAGIEKVSPSSNFRINGQKIPRESHRFSGRTSMLANINVSEPKPPEDTDSPLSYTMEGFRGMPPSSMIPFFWSPGWNSVQSTNKYQDEVGGELRGGDPGIRLVSHNGQAQVEYFKYTASKKEDATNRFEIVPLYHIFGSEQWSARGEAVSHRVPSPYLAMNPKDASRLQIEQDQPVLITLKGKEIKLHVKLAPALPEGLLGLPWGLPEHPYFHTPAITDVKRISETQTIGS
jgi:NADH-quinone oxidoreductase subunit G